MDTDDWWSGRSAATRRPSRASPSPPATGSMRWRTGSCATSTSPRMRASRRCSTIWRDLPQLRDPARFDAWSYRLLVRACYAEGRRTRRWAPNSDSCRPTSRQVSEGLGSVVDRDQLERGFRRLSIDHRRWWCCTTTSTCRSTRSPTCSASPSGRSDPDYITRCAACARPSRPTPGRRRGRLPDEHRSRRHPHRSVVAGGGRHGAPGPRPGHRARPAPRDPPAPSLVAGAEVRET